MTSSEKAPLAHPQVASECSGVIAQSHGRGRAMTFSSMRIGFGGTEHEGDAVRFAIHERQG